MGQGSGLTLDAPFSRSREVNLSIPSRKIKKAKSMAIIRISEERVRVCSSWFLTEVFLADEGRFDKAENPVWSEYPYYFVLEYRTGSTVYAVLPGESDNIDESELGSKKYPAVGELAHGKHKMVNPYLTEGWSKDERPIEPEEVLYVFESGKYEANRDAMLEFVHTEQYYNIEWNEYDR